MDDPFTDHGYNESTAKMNKLGNFSALVPNDKFIT